MYGSLDAPSAQGAPINTASTSTSPYNSQAPSPVTNPAATPTQPAPTNYIEGSQGALGGTYGAISAAPQWLQNVAQGQVVGGNHVGGFDPSIQLRDIYSGFQSGLNNAVQNYGANTVYNPYFMQGGNANLYNPQYSMRGFNPFSQNLNAYGTDNMGNIMNTHLNPFTGNNAGPSSLAAYRGQAFNYSLMPGDPVTNDITGYNQAFKNNYDQNYAPWLGTFDNWMSQGAAQARNNGTNGLGGYDPWQHISLIGGY